jgi:glycosyltransferase involved in cell wall biosynthesis
MKKVLVIAPYPFLPYSSGGQKFIAKFLEYLARETELTVVGSEINNWHLAGKYKGLPWLKPSFSRYYDAGLVKKITALVRQEKQEVLICEHPYMAWLAFRIRKRTGIPVVIHTHNIEYQRFRSLGKWWWPLLKWYEKRSFKKADGLFFISPEDREFATGAWKIPLSKCLDLPYGIEIAEYPADREPSRKQVAAQYGIEDEEMILAFNGALDYEPNVAALRVILDEINPRLLQQSSFRYKILISGKNLPEEMKGLEAYRDKNVIYTGFVEDIATLQKATDIFLNPVLGGGGVKTKIVEAIGYGATVISTATGAIGINRAVCEDKLIIVPDTDRDTIVSAVRSLQGKKIKTPARYYQYYHWESITAQTTAFLDKLT